MTQEFMNEQKKYKHHLRRNGLKWIIQGSIDKHFYKPHNKEYKIKQHSIAHRKIMSKMECHNEIFNLIKSNEPFWIARYGHTEMRFVNSVLYKRYVDGKITPENASVDDAIKQLCNNAGFFPCDKEYGEKFVAGVLEYGKNIDIHAIWDLWMEEYMIDCWEPNAKVIEWDHVAPYYLRKEDGIIPWTSALAGKKVLVINPFVESIEKQYNMNRERIFEKIFDSNIILPQFELKTLKSIQTAGGTIDIRFSNWFQALEYMVTRCREIDFDVALIGCGAYGFFLANEIKKMGKGAIQTCGSTQMIFGVLGKRWSQDSKLMLEVVNDAWIRPSLEERPKGYNNVEGGCYW